MTLDPASVQMIGFDEDSRLGDLFVQFGLFQDYKARLPELVLGILKKQHPDVVLESIEMLQVQKCKLGGMEQEQNQKLITVQTLDVPLDLRLTVHVGHSRLVLDVQLVIKCEKLDSAPTVRCDMFIRGQRAVS